MGKGNEQTLVRRIVELAYSWFAISALFNTHTHTHLQDGLKRNKVSKPSTPWDLIQVFRMVVHQNESVKIESKPHQYLR
jgi:hypothetical protein